MGATGEVYRFKNPLGGDPRPIAVDNIEDAKFFDSKSETIRVEWTAIGVVARSTKPPLDALKDLGYRQKQRLAKKFDIRANQKEATLEEELEPYVKELEEQI